MKELKTAEELITSRPNDKSAILDAVKLIRNKRRELKIELGCIEKLGQTLLESEMYLNRTENTLSDFEKRGGSEEDAIQTATTSLQGYIKLFKRVIHPKFVQLKKAMGKLES